MKHSLDATTIQQNQTAETMHGRKAPLRSPGGPTEENSGEPGYDRRGYLREPFQIFHLKDTPEETFSYHYHDFHKMMILLSGNISYKVEGKTYDLKPYDFVLIPRNEIHRPELSPSTKYERIILYANFRSMDPLASCFRYVKEKGQHTLRFPANRRNRLVQTLHNLLDASAASADIFAYQEYKSAIFTQFFIELYRFMTEDTSQFMEPVVQDEKLSRILSYLNTHLSEDLDIEFLSAHFFMSKYHLMRTFKTKTGYSIHNYVTIKRMFLAKNMLAENYSVAEAALQCGYRDYSTFSRAFHNFNGISPQEYRKSLSL